MNTIARVLVGTSLAVGALPAVATPALAECTNQLNRWPAFEEVAPTARQVVIGRVTKTNKRSPVDLVSSVFTLEVEEVLKGEAPAIIEVDRLRSGLPPRGSRSCVRDSALLAAPGDRVALAIGGKIPGIKGRLNTAAWIEGQPSVDTNPGLLRMMELNEIRKVVGLEPVPSFRAIVSGRSASIEGDMLVLEDVPAVPYVSDWPVPAEGTWDVETFVEGWDSAQDLGHPSAVLLVADSQVGTVVALEVTDIEVAELTVRIGFTVAQGRAPSGVLGPTSLLVEIDANPATWKAADE